MTNVVVFAFFFLIVVDSLTVFCILLFRFSLFQKLRLNEERPRSLTHTVHSLLLARITLIE